MDLEELKRVLNSFDSWEFKFNQLVNLSKKMPPMPVELQNDKNRIKSCGSNVWVCPILINNKIKIHGDSNSQLMKGLLYITSLMYENKSTNEGFRLNLMGELKDLNILKYFSATRYNGVSGISIHIRKFCQEN